MITLPRLRNTKAENNKTKAESNCRQLCSIPIKMIESNPHRIRQNLDDIEILALADSIRKYGLMAPILVKTKRRNIFESAYVIIAGERRFRALKMLDWKEVPCFVANDTENETDILTIAENISRNNPLFVDICEYVDYIAKNADFSCDELASLFSVKSENIEELLRISNMSQQEKEKAREKRYDYHTLKALSKIDNEKKRFDLMKQTDKSNLSLCLTNFYLETLEEAGSCSCVEEGLGKSIMIFADYIKSVGHKVTGTKFENENEIKITINIEKK